MTLQPESTVIVPFLLLEEVGMSPSPPTSLSVAVGFGVLVLLGALVVGLGVLVLLGALVVGVGVAEATAVLLTGTQLSVQSISRQCELTNSSSQHG